MFLSDHQIAKRAKEGMIEPFEERQIKYGIERAYPNSTDRWEIPVISYGNSSYGYDVRIDREFLFPKFDPTANPVVDPKNISVSDFIQHNADVIDIPPHSFVLGKTLEYFRIPRDILALCVGKSTYARCGINVNVTPLEPEWEGNVTIEITNNNVKPVRIYAGEGIAQFLFALCEISVEFDDDNGIRMNCENNLCQTSYADKKGKYQGQTSVTPPRA